MRLISGLFLLAISTLLFVLNTLHEDGSRDSYNFIFGFVENFSYRTLEVDEAIDEFAKLRSQNVDRSTPEKLFTLVSRSFLQRGTVELGLLDNWVLWLMSLFYDRGILESQDMNLLWSKGEGSCHQAAGIYVIKARELGLQARILWLNGHVAAEVYVPDRGWSVVDPGLGIFWEHPLDAFGTTLSLEAIRSRISERGFTDFIADWYAVVYASWEDNTRGDVPWDVPKARTEQASHYMAWGVPVLFSLLSLLLIFGSAFNREFR